MKAGYDAIQLSELERLRHMPYTGKKGKWEGGREVGRERVIDQRYDSRLLYVDMNE